MKEIIEVKVGNDLIINAIKIDLVNSRNDENGAVSTYLCYAQNRLFLADEKFCEELHMSEDFNREVYDILIRSGNEFEAYNYAESKTITKLVSIGIEETKILVEYCVIHEYDDELMYQEQSEKNNYIHPFEEDLMLPDYYE